ncbi:DsbA family protein [Patescibacteria group bacterium]
MTAQKTSSDKLVPILVLVTIGMAFGLGVMWQKVNNLQPKTPTKVGEGVADDTMGAKDVVDVPTEGISFGKLSDTQAAAVTPVSDQDHILGSSDAKVYLVEYSDLECPYCGSFHSTAQQAVDEYDGQVAWVYRHYPLDQLHPNARPAAEAAECAAQIAGNDGFWGFLDAAFENQSQLSDLDTVAEAAGLNSIAIADCVEAGIHEDAVESQFQGGLTAGVTGTPGNFIIGPGGVWFIPGAYPIEDLRSFIDEALEG